MEWPRGQLIDLESPAATNTRGVRVVSPLSPAPGPGPSVRRLLVEFPKTQTFSYSPEQCIIALYRNARPPRVAQPRRRYFRIFPCLARAGFRNNLHIITICARTNNILAIVHGKKCNKKQYGVKYARRYPGYLLKCVDERVRGHTTQQPSADGTKTCGKSRKNKKNNNNTTIRLKHCLYDDFWRPRKPEKPRYERPAEKNTKKKKNVDRNTLFALRVGHRSCRRKVGKVRDG